MASHCRQSLFFGTEDKFVCCCHLKTCFLDVSSHFGKQLFLTFNTLNMAFIDKSDLVAAWTHAHNDQKLTNSPDNILHVKVTG